MTMIITGSCQINANFQNSGSLAPGALPFTAQQSFGFKPLYPPVTPGAANESDKRHALTYALAAAPQDIDLTNVVDTFGNLFAFARVRYFSIRIRSTNLAHVLLLGSATTLTHAWTALVSNPGTYTVTASTSLDEGGNFGSMVTTAPNVDGLVVDSTHKILRLDPGASTFMVDVEILGCSA